MEITETYVNTLKSKTFKIIPLFEDGNSGITNYIGSYIYELKGLTNLLDKKQESMLISIVAILENMYTDSLEPVPDIKSIRREVFGCMSLFDKILKCGEL